MIATRTKDRPAAQAATIARANRRKRGVAGAESWTFAETVPGTFRVLSSSGGDYAVWYYPETDAWSCSCPDFSGVFGAAHQLGIECKHIFAVQARDDLVDPETKIPLSLAEQATEEDALTQASPSHEEDTHMTSTAFTEEVAEALATPFPATVHAFRPGAKSRDGKSALALIYIASHLYHSRLDEVDPAWQSEYQVIALDDRVLVKCRLTIRGVTREDVGEGAFSLTRREGTVPEENAYTSAATLSFQRVCAQFGLGRYLYELPKLWAEYDQQRGCFTTNGTTTLRKALRKLMAETDAARVVMTKPPKPIPESSANELANAEQKDAIGQMLHVLGYSDRVAQEDALAQAGFTNLDRLTIERANQAIARLELAIKKAKKARAVSLGDNGRS
jgi:hypothetical protein